MEAEARAEGARAEEAAQGEEVARADDAALPAETGEDADVRPAVVEEIRLKESWRRWEEEVVAHTGAKEVEAPAREQSREAGVAEPRDAGVVESREVSGLESREVGGGEPRGVAGEVSAPPAPPLMRPQSTPPATREARSDSRGDSLLAEGAPAAAAGGAAAEAGAAGAPLARPRALEKGRRAAAVKESLRPRVERVRDASLGVLEDAAEDSGLRFVLIALALFALFIVFLLVNNLVR